MIDIHSHLIYGVDDGSENIETSINILESLSNSGVTDIILTPHYIDGTTYTSKKLDNIVKLKELQKELSNNNININLYLGNEIYIFEDIYKLIKENKICSLNNTEYILVELPMNGIYPEYLEIFNDLLKIGFKVILAHPERYTAFQNDYNKIHEMVNNGILLQCNVDSILGKYGSKAKKTMKYILKNKLLSFVGTDIHYDRDDYTFIDRAKKLYKKYLTDEEIDIVFNKNAKEIIRKNEDSIRYKNNRKINDIFR